MLLKHFSDNAFGEPQGVLRTQKLMTTDRSSLIRLGGQIGQMTLPIKQDPTSNFLSPQIPNQFRRPITILVFNGGFDSGKSLQILGIAAQQFDGNSDFVPTIDELEDPACRASINSLMQDGMLRGKVHGHNVGHSFSNIRGNYDLDALYERTRDRLHSQNMSGMLILSNAEHFYCSDSMQTPWLFVDTNVAQLEDMLAAEALGLDTRHVVNALNEFIADLEIDYHISSIDEFSALLEGLEDYQQDRLMLAFEATMANQFFRIISLSLPNDSPYTNNPHFMNLWNFDGDDNVIAATEPALIRS